MTKQIVFIFQVAPRHTIAQPNTSADAHIKNWHSRHNILSGFVNLTNYSIHKTCTATLDLANFLCLPWALQMIFDVTDSSGRYSHLQGRTFYNGALFKFL
jgi:hypothetical protein